MFDVLRFYAYVRISILLAIELNKTPCCQWLGFVWLMWTTHRKENRTRQVNRSYLIENIFYYMFGVIVRVKVVFRKIVVGG